MIEVESFEYLDSVDVYDLHIDHEDHSYHCQDIPVHNSGYCSKHDGRKYKTIEEINAALYSHFNCRSIEVALTGNKISDARASQFGQVNGETYETWFKKLPESVQKSTLTGRQYKAYLDGDFKVESIVDVTKKQSLGMIQRTIEDYI